MGIATGTQGLSGAKLTQVFRQCTNLFILTLYNKWGGDCHSLFFDITFTQFTKKCKNLEKSIDYLEIIVI